MTTTQAIKAGEDTTLSVTATGNGTVSYQWYKNNVAIDSATTSSSYKTTTAGEYKVVVKNTIVGVYFSTTSTVCKLTITPVTLVTTTTKTVEVIQTPASIPSPQLISVVPVGEAFSQPVEVRFKDDSAVKAAIETAFDTALKAELKDIVVFPMDISLYVKGTDTKIQPNAGTSVTITFPIPEALLANKDKIKVVCLIDGKLTVLETKILLVEGVWCVQFSATHFSPYAMVVDANNELHNTVANPKTDQSYPIVPIALLAILSMSTLAVVSKKRKFIAKKV